MKSSNKKICWITATYMLQVDLPILSPLANKYNIDWYFWGNPNSTTAKLAKEHASEHHINIQFLFPNYWVFNPIGVFREWKIINALKKKNYDIYYFDVSTFPFLLYVIKALLPKEKVVIAMHHGKLHSGMRFKPLYAPFLKYLNGQDMYLQYFSQNQADAFTGKNSNKKYIIPLALNDFGESTDEPAKDVVTFTAFGNIIDSKNIPLLIQAGNLLYEEIPGKFKVKIVGHCRDWQTRYAPMIRHAEAFDLDIRRIDENEIPSLFSTSHFLMLPYKSVTQSGPLRIAYGYNTPVIASDLDGFKESVEEGVTGLLFRSEDVLSLKDTMRKVVENHPHIYQEIKSKQKEYVRNNLTVDKICDQYSSMFDNILSSSN